jgi:hypothetical protein
MAVSIVHLAVSIIDGIARLHFAVAVVTVKKTFGRVALFIALIVFE